MIYLGSDHRGFEYKERLKQWFGDRNIKFEDCGAFDLKSDDDFVDFASSVARKVMIDYGHRGILICNNGVGMDISANKYDGIRCVLAFDVEQVRLARNDDDTNVIAIPSGFLSFEKILDLIEVFLNTPFSNQERFNRRLGKIKIIEHDH